MDNAERALHETKYCEVADSVLRRHVEGALSPEILETHTLTEILKTRDGWLLKLSPDSLKILEIRAQVRTGLK